MKKCFWMLLVCLLLACSCALAECSLCGGDSVCDTCGGNGYMLMQLYGTDEQSKVVCTAGCDNGRCPTCAVPCDVCGSDQKCDVCGGNGYVIMHAYGTGEEVKAVCPGQHCADGQCTACAQPEEAAQDDGAYVFTDPVVEKVVRGLMGWEDRTITREDLLSITVLLLDESDDWKLLPQVTSLKDVAQMKNVRELSFSGVPVTTEMLAEISGLASLEYLNLCEQDLPDISPLATLTQLRTLSIGACNVSDLSPLAPLTKLQKLIVTLNEASDITPLSVLTELRELSLSSNFIKDISPLSGLTELNVLYLDDNLIEDVSPLKTLKNLKYLYLNENPIRNASVLNSLDLEELWID